MATGNRLKFFEIPQLSQTILADRSILTQYRKYRSQVKTVIAIMVFTIALNFVIPLTNRSLMNDGLLLEDRSYVNLIILIQLLMYLLLIASHFIRTKIIAYVSNIVNTTIAHQFMYHITKLPINEYEAIRQSSMIENMRDFEKVQRFYSIELLEFLTALISIISLSLLLLWISLTLFLIFCISAVVYVLWVVISGRQRLEVDKERFRTNAKMHGIESSIFSAIQDIKLAGMERRLIMRWEEVQADALRARLRGAGIEQVQLAGSNLISRIGLLSIVMFTTSGVLAGYLTLGDMLITSTIAVQLNFHISQILTFVNRYQETNAAFQRVDKVRSIECEGEIAEEPRFSGRAIETISFNNVSFSYPGSHRKALSDFSMIAERGQRIGLVGLSGSGKSTVLRLLIGLSRAQEGQVLLNDIPLEEINELAIRKRIGAVFQEGKLFPATMRENIIGVHEEIDEGWLKKVVEAAQLNSVVEQLSNGLETEIGPFGQNLSVGQVQRVLIARALFKKPDVLVMDEATSALDPKTELQIVTGIAGLLPETTSVVAAHRLATIKDADTIYVLSNGVCVEFGTHSELAAENGIYSELWRPS